MSVPLILGKPSFIRVFRRYLTGEEISVNLNGAEYVQVSPPFRIDSGRGDEHVSLRRVHLDRRGKEFTHRLARMIFGEEVIVPVADLGWKPTLY